MWSPKISPATTLSRSSWPGILQGTKVSVSCRHRTLAYPRAPPEIEARFHDALSIVDINDGAVVEGDVAGAEVVVVVLDKGGHPVREGIFAADADCPSNATPQVGLGERHAIEVESKAIPLPGRATLHVAEETVPCPT